MEICRKHYWGIGSSETPCEECGVTVKFTPEDED